MASAGIMATRFGLASAFILGCMFISVVAYRIVATANRQGGIYRRGTEIHSRITDRHIHIRCRLCYLCVRTNPTLCIVRKWLVVCCERGLF